LAHGWECCPQHSRVPAASLPVSNPTKWYCHGQYWRHRRGCCGTGLRIDIPATAGDRSQWRESTPTAPAEATPVHRGKKSAAAKHPLSNAPVGVGRTQCRCRTASVLLPTMLLLQHDARRIILHFLARRRKTPGRGLTFDARSKTPNRPTHTVARPRNQPARGAFCPGRRSTESPRTTGYYGRTIKNEIATRCPPRQRTLSPARWARHYVRAPPMLGFVPSANVWGFRPLPHHSKTYPFWSSKTIGRDGAWRGVSWRDGVLLVSVREETKDPD